VKREPIGRSGIRRFMRGHFPILLSALAVVVLAGCASHAPDPRESWQGAPYDEVVLAWGTPARSARLSDGRLAYTWVSDGSLPRSGASPSIGVGIGSGGVGIGTGIVFGSSGSAELVRCERTLIFDGGRVVDQTWQGTNEYCNGFGRPPTH